jgi:hypothetical protein
MSESARQNTERQLEGVYVDWTIMGKTSEKPSIGLRFKLYWIACWMAIRWWFNRWSARPGTLSTPLRMVRELTRKHVSVQVVKRAGHLQQLNDDPMVTLMMTI